MTLAQETDRPITPILGGLYVHIPFCRRKCAYCDFFSTTDLSLKPAFLDALAREIAAAEPPPFVFDTIHLGGGTPSLLESTEVAGILDASGRNSPSWRRSRSRSRPTPGP